MGGSARSFPRAASGYTFVENAHEYRLTPWFNDAVCDPTGEAFYLRDEETGDYWSPTPLPARAAGTCANRAARFWVQHV